MNPKDIEKYTSAMTLSDMEVFVFPELMYSLVLANIMSPIIWKWQEIDCFRKLQGENSYKKLMRLRQFIMDEYEFNLDIETWGLTNKTVEIKRFEQFIPQDEIAKSNALFGYEGDRYYFDVDIRRHFGLDKYNDDIIPYWKTETIEAMDSFRLKKGYTKSAGECVSLSALYAAAAFIVCKIPLEDIYMVLTPLHSQNFIDINDGVLTNNRRLVTKTMWFNGTAISEKAQRALRNEQVTVVAHNSGYVHCLYNEATMKESSYKYFIQKIKEYLSTDLTTLTLANFLRCNPKYQKYFQFCCELCRGGPKFVKAEVLFHYEHGSNFRIADDTFERLLTEVSDEDILPYKLENRLCCQQLCGFVKDENIDIHKESGREAIKNYLAPFVPETDDFVKDLFEFVHIEPKVPSPDKDYITNEPINLSPKQSREQIIEYLQSMRTKSHTADLAFYAYRDMKSCDWVPFIKAALQRNPVSIQMAKSMSLENVYHLLNQMNDTSIYDGQRLAQPDEVSNYMTGDGLEKAFLLANIILGREPKQNIEIIVDNDNVNLKAASEYKFKSCKNLKKTVQITGENGFKAVE
jgi:hypothetical protein